MAHRRSRDLADAAIIAEWTDLIRSAAFAPKGEKRAREAKLRDFVNNQLAREIRRPE